MDITMNNVGNYTPNIKPRTTNNNQQKFNLEQNQAVNQKTAVSENITAEEKKYFMNLYPENKKEITEYHFYQKTGQMSGIKIGSNFDRRG